MMKDDAVTGVTSNPSIFQKALSRGRRLRRADEGAARARPTTRREIFFALALDDIRDACDVLKPAYDASDGADGYVSMEVEPGHRLRHREDVRAGALDREGGRPAEPDGQDPGDDAGAAGDRGLHRARHVDQHHADLLARALQGRRRGVHPRARAPGRRRRRSRRRSRSVASFFVSRVDTEADKRLEALGNKKLQGKLAIANAKLAYAHFLEAFQGPRWEYLEGKGATKQRCLWASTSTKNPAYRDVIYVEELIGPDTVNTMPLETIEAFQDHGEVRGDTVLEGVGEAQKLLAELARGRRRLRRRRRRRSRQEGVQKFSDSFDEIARGHPRQARELAAA